MLEVKILAAGRRYVAPESLRTAVGAERARERLADAIEALVTQLDLIDGDPDLELDTSDFEPSGDEGGDPAWCEWHTLPAATRRTGKLNSKPLDSWRGMIGEDEEEDDAREEDDHSGQCDEDGINTAQGYLHGVGTERGPGCAISDPPDVTRAERFEQFQSGVPWENDDDEPRVAPNVWAAERQAHFYRPPANLN